MKKTIYITTFADNEKKHYSNSIKSLCELFNNKFNTNKYKRETIMHLIYRSGKNRLGVKIERVCRDMFFQKYIDAYLNALQANMIRYDEYHQESIKRMKNQYVMAIQDTLLDALNDGVDETSIDKMVYLANPYVVPQ